MASVNANSNDVIKGGRGQLDVAPYIGSAASGTFVHYGWMDGLNINPTVETADIEPENCQHAIGTVQTKKSYTIAANLYQADLVKFANALGGVDADVNVITGTATLPLKEGGVNYKQVRIEVADQSMAPAHSIVQTYVKRAWTFWMGVMKITGGITYSVKEPVSKTPIQITCYHDTSVTESAILGAIGKVVDTTTGSYTA